MMYSVTFVNKSTNSGDVCIYQTNPTLVQGVMTLAWIAKSAHPTTSIQFEWYDDYDFVWSEKGELEPGIIFKASQVWSADLNNSNKVGFTLVDDAYTFRDQTRGLPGDLFIEMDHNIPLNKASVGIGMSGSATFAANAQPNITLSFHPDSSSYWITFGSYEMGEVLDVTQITNKAQLNFPANIYSLTATLNQDNTWTIEVD